MIHSFPQPTQPAIVFLLHTHPELRLGEENLGPDTSHWRSSEIYDYLDHLVAPDLAWEWLRRNPRYQREFAESEQSAAAAQRFAELVRPRWGLRFRDQPISRRH